MVQFGPPGDDGQVPPGVCYPRYVAIAIFLGTYFVLAAGDSRTKARPHGRGDHRRQPHGGANVLTMEEAYRAINFDTIVLLFGMMIVVANLRLPASSRW